GNLCVEHLTDPERLAWACPRRYPGRLRRRELVEAIAAHDPHVLVVNPVLLVPRGPQHPDQLKALWRRELLEAAARHASRCEAEPAPPEPDVDPAEVAAVEDALRGENRCQ
ncbi:MAG TPA: hypothetical protein VN088_19685, partial [Nocardioides sp.]|nr:hypothetical protein [Nocardioides sp.]